MNLTKEKSQEQAVIIKEISMLVLSLDTEYLSEALAVIEKNHSFRESAAVLNPNPFIHNEQQELNGLKISQLRSFLEIAKNAGKIMRAEVELGQAKARTKDLENIFAT